MQAVKKKDLKDLPVVVVGTKSDLLGSVSQEDIAKRCMNEMDSPFVECSAEDDVKILSVFQLLCDELGIYGSIYEKVFEIQCREAMEKANKKMEKARTKST